VFETSADPIELGLVGSISRPGGNVTGVSQLNVEVVPKRLELLHELLPTVRVMALVANPADGALGEVQSRAVLLAARSLGLEVHVLNASTEGDLEGVFAKLIQLRAGGLLISGGALFTSYSEQLAALAARHAVPAASPHRRFAEAGGLLSYGSDVAEAYRLAGIYTGRVLKGEKPVDLPVQQATKVELYINLKTAKTLGITIPLPLSGRADQLIE
jgi:putative tryptophan/tyrosine transport system substrate-binding protein